MEVLAMEKLDLGILEKVCQILFDQLGFTIKLALPPSISGVSGISVLYSKNSNTSFALYQCAVRQAQINLNLLRQLKDFLIQLKLPSAYFITTGSTEGSIREFATANQINLIDCLKLSELINNLPESSRNLLAETISAAQALPRFQPQTNETGRNLGQPELGTPPICAKCGERMELQISAGIHMTGKYWLCPNSDCGHIAALV